jgi:hypothetical protein
VTRFLVLRETEFWKNHVVKGNLKMFPLLLGLENEEAYQQISSLIENNLEEMRKQIKHNFHSFSTQGTVTLNHLLRLRI